MKDTYIFVFIAKFYDKIKKKKIHWKPCKFTFNLLCTKFLRGTMSCLADPCQCWFSNRLDAEKTDTYPSKTHAHTQPKINTQTHVIVHGGESFSSICVKISDAQKYCCWEKGSPRSLRKSLAGKPGKGGGEIRGGGGSPSFSHLINDNHTHAY